MLKHILQHPQFSQAHANRPGDLSLHVWQLPLLIHGKIVEVAILSKALIIPQP